MARKYWLQVIVCNRRVGRVGVDISRTTTYNQFWPAFSNTMLNSHEDITLSSLPWSTYYGFRPISATLLHFFHSMYCQMENIWSVVDLICALEILISSEIISVYGKQGRFYIILFLPPHTWDMPMGSFSFEREMFDYLLNIGPKTTRPALMGKALYFRPSFLFVADEKT